MTLNLLETVLSKPNEYQVFVDGIAYPFGAYGIEKQLSKLNRILKMKTDVAMGVTRLNVEESATLTEEDVRAAVPCVSFWPTILNDPSKFCSTHGSGFVGVPFR